MKIQIFVYIKHIPSFYYREQHCALWKASPLYGTPQLAAPSGPHQQWLSAQPSVQYQGRKGIQVFHVWMSYQDLVDLQFLLRVREDLQQGRPQLTGLCGRSLGWYEKVLLYTGNGGQRCEVGLLREPRARRGSLVPGWRLVAGVGYLGVGAPEARIEHAHIWQGTE